MQLFNLSLYLCDKTYPEIIKFSKFKQFFEQTWAPILIKLHSPGGETFDDLLKGITVGFPSMSNSEVCFC